ncbi:amino acid ABC transporter substrate-binding protein [Actinomarinicola tropica]|uniref:Transporter substrate-binding domain-containing protein n=1 Tax=Actinomarinicola tropica TaxID=2789776 RepID=A0A5Q2RNH8_9ACTN|nr:amino acid ABC transporter substrate-binding protein [Actinomarinicola tropica]QGG96141.1 transporter substrate-binding domain-containing protein [Actinomarinicola tropica]
MNQRRWRWAAVLAVGAMLLGACSGDDADDDASDDGSDTTQETVEFQPAQDGESLLASVQEAGTLVCGVNDAVPGFGVIDEEGNFSGFDIDYCRVIAAAVLGDADAVEYRPLAAADRFTALQSGEIDVLVRNTTWTATRDGGEGAAFAMTTFYDGQGMMVRSGEYSSIDDMDGTSICVLSGTTTELNLASRFNAAGLTYEPLSFEDNDLLREAFISGQCDGWTSDKSQLAAVRSAYPDADGGPEALTILDETFSKEPLGPAVRDGDPQWYDAVNWAVISTIQAEEWGITSENVDDFLDSEDPEILRFLGQPAGEDNAVLDPGLGLSEDFAYEVISQVGNYGEIYERHVGPDTALGLERGLNDLYTEGGLLYPPPYR